MKPTVISHFYNEEYLLPHWLNYHKKYFGHGILINYTSTDKSVDIIKEICPTWDIVDSKHRYFRAICCDEEVQEIEAGITGWRIALNITEFLFGNFDLLTDTAERKQYIIGCNVMVDRPEDEFTELHGDLLRERHFGLPYSKYPRIRRFRSLHNFSLDYKSQTGPGRHYNFGNTNEFFICWYGLSPYNEHLIKRKLQVRYKYWPGEIGYWQPSDHGFIELEKEFYAELKSYQPNIVDMSNDINKFL